MRAADPGRYRRPPRRGLLEILGPERIAITAIALGLVGVGFAGGRGTADDRPLVLDLDAAMELTPTQMPNGRLDPDYKDLAIAALQHAVAETDREAAAARRRASQTPELAGSSPSIEVEKPATPDPDEAPR